MRVGPHRESHEPRLSAEKFVTLASGFIDGDVTGGITDFGMDNNDVWGDCGVAAPDHSNVCKTGSTATAGSFGTPKFATLLDAYWAYGLSQGEVGQSPNQPDQPDNGVDNASFLGWCYKNGIIDGYGEVPFSQLDSFMVQFHGVIVGTSIDGDTAISDFNASPKVPWPSMPNAQDGHDILVAKTNADGSGFVVTWGGLQPYTSDFRTTNFQDAWVIFDHDDPSVDWVSLQAALESVHGTVSADPSAPSGESPESIIHDVESFVEDEVEKVVEDVRGLFVKGSLEATVTPPDADSAPSAPVQDPQAHTAFLQRLDRRLRDMLDLIAQCSTEEIIIREIERLALDYLK